MKAVLYYSGNFTNQTGRQVQFMEMSPDPVLPSPPLSGKSYAPFYCRNGGGKVL